MPSDRQGWRECRNGRSIFRPWHFTVVGADLCCLSLSTELSAGHSHRRRRSRGADEGFNSTDHHMTGRHVLSVAGMRFSVSVESTLRSTFSGQPNRSVSFTDWYDTQPQKKPVLRPAFWVLYPSAMDFHPCRSAYPFNCWLLSSCCHHRARSRCHRSFPAQSVHAHALRLSATSWAEPCSG